MLFGTGSTQGKGLRESLMCCFFFPFLFCFDFSSFSHDFIISIVSYQERKATTQSVGEALASSTPSLSRSSSMSGADNGLHTSVLSQVHSTFLIEVVRNMIKKVKLCKLKMSF